MTEAEFNRHGFAMQKMGIWDVWCRKDDMVGQLLEASCREPKTEADGFKQLVCGKHSEVYRFEVGGRAFYFKEFLSRGWKEWVKNRFRDARAVRALQGELTLKAAGLQSPPIILIGMHGERNFMVTEEIPNATNLYFMITAPEKYPIPPHRFATRLGELVGTLHANGISHGDLRWGNILWNGAGTNLNVYFIDNERTVGYPKLPDRLRFKNLVQMAMSAALLPRYLVLRFFAAYLKMAPELRQQKREWLKRVGETAQARLERAKLRNAQ